MACTEGRQRLMKPDRGMPLSRYLLTLFLGVFCFLAGYNANGDSEWISNLDTLARVQGNEFGIRDMVFQKGAIASLFEYQSWQIVLSFMFLAT